MNSSPSEIERPCPSCGTAMTLAPADQVEGRRLRCLHCNAEAVVTREWDEALGDYHWTLDDSEDELPPERV